ncbi:uncharacterized protein LOC113510048 [Galleria mellonella]|uniref:Uncharacterized protein LOC113510048 n=1 Tax=Galleria mellonella TaxID=7137 RepID=A0ABM3MS98_GALME|nr:uncharacterized protein LOC113510048 [Galleria mellonella]
MDETQQSRSSEASAAATRKRRSSILKSQRPPRTPFSEVEFNVATPTDTTKSRRVSFSRRTGVAEFVTNEATTTWKNFYEEHNKTLESSGNDSEGHALRPPIGHLGKRIFDQQFEEVEVENFLTSLDTLTNRNVNSSFNNANFTEQLVSLDCADNKLPMPNNNFELSAFTEHQSKVFGDDLIIPTMGEMSGKIDVNFSTMQTIGGDDKDDLDEIQRDLMKKKNNVVGLDYFKGGRDISEYIEVDLNVTHANLRDEESDMSITDTIRCPKVQDVSKISNSSQVNLKTNYNDDWVCDKENIAINPYITPKETLNFAINEESDKVLVFDGKRLTVQSGKEADAVLGTKKSYQQNSSYSTKRKTVVINVNDDLPNFGEVSSHSLSRNISKHSMLYDDDDLSLSQALSNPISEKRKTILYEENAGNISVTQAVPSNIILSEKNNIDPERRRTVVYENDTGNISITQAVSSNIIIPNKKETTEKRRTIVYENDTSNISITQALPSNIMSQNENLHMPDKRKTIIYESDLGEISMTQAIPTNILAVNIDKNKTLNYDNDVCDISMTQAVPSNLILSNKNEERRKTVIYENDTGDISVTQAISSNIILPNSQESKKIKTVFYSDDMADISLTQAVDHNVSLPKTETSEKRRTDYENDKSNISVTQAVPSNIILNQRKTIVEEVTIKTSQVDVSEKIIISNEDLSKRPSFIKEKRCTIVFKNDDDISMTQTVPTNIHPVTTLLSEKKNSISHSEMEVISQLHSTPSKIESNDKRRTIVCENDTTNISVTQVIPTNIILSNTHETSSKNSKTIIHDNNVSVTQVNYNNFLSEEINGQCKKASDNINAPIIEMSKKQMDIKRKTIVFEADNDNADMSVTATVPQKLIKNNIIEPEKKKTITYHDETSNLSMTKPILAKIISIQNEILDTSKKNNVADLNQPTNNSSYEQVVMNSANQDVLVYQAVTHVQQSSPKIQTEIEKGYSKLEEPASNTCNKMSSRIKLENANDFVEAIPMSDHEDEINEVITQTMSNNQSINTKNIHETPQSLSRSTINIETKIQPDNEIAQNIELETKSILKDLLDMSDASMESAMEDKNLMTEKPSNCTSVKTNTESSSSEIFIIRKDKEGAQTVENEENIDDNSKPVEGEKCLMLTKELPKLQNPSLPLEYKEEIIPEIVNDLQKSLYASKDSIKEKSPLNNRHHKKIVSSDLNVEKGNSNKSQRLDVSKFSKSFKEADNTKELLDMLSDFTDRRNSVDRKETEEMLPKKVKGNIALENKSSIVELERLSIAPRKSIVISREDLIKNISMAQAALQMSIDMDESDSIDETIDTPMEECTSHKKSIRVSNEVVKTLHFEDDSVSENSIKSDTQVSPLKKTAFGETTYMKESKAKVIPSYLKDVSDGLKALMTDLVKPMADVLPFDTVDIDKCVKKSPSTCSTQIQANLITSSQVDMDIELYSNTESAFDLDKTSIPSRTFNVDKTSPYKSCMKQTLPSESEMIVDDLKEVSFRPKRLSIEQTVPGKVLVFDHENPLNNVLLVPTEYPEVHRYNPSKSSETLCGSDRDQSVQYSSEELNNKHISTHGKVESVNLLHSVKQSGDTDSEIPNTESLISNISKPQSIDQSTDVEATEVKNTEVNTVIAMKGNKELLEANSSLTLVDDAHARSIFDINLDTRATASKNDVSKRESQSLVKIIYKQEQIPNALDKIDSDLTSNDEEQNKSIKIMNNPKKRNYSPSNKDKYDNRTLSTIDITPKPVSKMQKTSNTPNTSKNIGSKLNLSPEKLIATAEKDESKSDMKEELENFDTKIESKLDVKSTKGIKSPSKSRQKHKKPLTDVTVRQLVTKYDINPKVDQELNKQILEELNKCNSKAPNTVQSDVSVKSPDIVSSFTSSKNQMEMRVGEQDSAVTTSSNAETMLSQQREYRSLWRPEVSHESSVDVSECESSANVVTKIDMLPFMGSHECEWESSGADMWSFRLLHGRLRLTVRLEHRHHDSTRTRVRADTPVLSATVDTTYHANDKKNSVASLCVGFAMEAMRYVVGEGCGRAGDVPGLLRRCAAVARVALRWGRAMHEARMHLAYTLTDDCCLTLRVANMAMRCVWEVRMRMELVVERAGGAPWPRAAAPQLSSVLGGRPLPARPLQRLLVAARPGWGHVPTAVWKIFKYLKHKTRDDLHLGM